MTVLWVAAEVADTSVYRPLWCAQGERHLLVAMEGPHLSAPDIVAGETPKLSHMVIRGDMGWTPEDGFGSSGPANLWYLSSHRYLHSGFYTAPPADVTRLEISFVDGDERVLFRTAYARHRAGEPAAGLWRTRGPLPDGFVLLGAGTGVDVFYAYCEGPYEPGAEPDSRRFPASVEWDFTLGFPDSLPQPRRDTVHLSRTGKPDSATRATLLFRVPRQGRDPDAFTVQVTEPGTGRLILDLDAYRS